MNIVLEGPDGAGKSTLASLITAATGMPLVPGNGPPKSEEEFRLRCTNYLSHGGVVFDRHPMISEPIYAEAIERRCLVDPLLSGLFWASRPFIVYVRPSSRHLPSDHACKDHETIEHVAAMEKRHPLICDLYDERMLEVAHYIYRRNDTSLVDILKAASEYLYGRNQATIGTFSVAPNVGGHRWTATSSRQHLADKVRELLTPELARVFCNKCGFHGYSKHQERGIEYPHLKPMTHATCNYTACLVA